MILIGEMRDLETAEAAIQASLTGHLVFSTLHTNDAPSAFTRLIDMGVEPFLVASTVEGVMAQRLVRTICPDCKTKYEPRPPATCRRTSRRSTSTSRPVPTVWKGTGCRSCRQTGYRGRTGIHELLVNNDADPRPGRPARERRRDPPRGAQGGDDDPAAGRLAEGAARHHDDRRSVARTTAGDIIAYDVPSLESSPELQTGEATA